MPRSRASTFVRPLIVAAVSSACFIEQPPAPITTVLFIQGTVVSAANDAPIAGAIVRLAIGGNFANAPALTTNPSDATGHFKLTDFVQHRPGECGYWVGATSDGYRAPQRPEDVVFIQCDSDTQIIQLRLQPLP